MSKCHGQQLKTGLWKEAVRIWNLIMPCLLETVILPNVENDTIKEAHIGLLTKKKQLCVDTVYKKTAGYLFPRGLETTWTTIIYILYIFNLQGLLFLMFCY